MIKLLQEIVNHEPFVSDLNAAAAIGHRFMRYVLRLMKGVSGNVFPEEIDANHNSPQNPKDGT